MRASNLLHLYRIRLRQRLVQELLAAVGIAVGVALVFASLVANTSLKGSVEHLTYGVVGDMPLQIAARSPDGLPSRLVDAVRDQPGVHHAAPVLETWVVLSGPEGERAAVLFAGDAELASWGGSLLRPFRSPRLAQRRAVALPAPIARDLGASLDTDLRITTGIGTSRTALGAQLHDSDIGDLVHSPVVIAPLAYAQQLTGMEGRVSRIFVAPEPKREEQVADALRALVRDRANVLPSDADVDVFTQAALPTRQSTGLFSVLAAVVGFLFAMSAVLLTVPQRRRFITDLRYAGHSPATAVQVILTDGLVLGVVSSALGLALGDQLSRHLFDDVPGYLSFAWPLGEQRIVTWSSVAIAVTAGIMSGCVAVLVPLRDILARDLSFSRPRRAGRRGGWASVGAGGVCLAGAMVILALAPGAAIAGIVLVAAAMLLLLPSMLEAGVHAMAWLGQWVRSPAPAIAVMELRSRSARTRTLALAATGAVAVFGSVAIGGAHRDLIAGLDASASDIDRNADLWATFPGAPNAFATTPFTLPQRTLEAIESVPGIARVSVYRGGFLDVGNRRVWVLGPPADDPHPVPPSQLPEGRVAEVTAQMRSGGSVVVSEALADEQGVEVGDRLRVPSPEPIALRVAAVSTNLGWPPGALILNSDDFAEGWGSFRPTALHVEVDPAASPVVVAEAVRRALGSSLPLTVETTGEREQRHHAAARQGLSRLTAISVLVLGAAILAMAAAMGGVLWQRRAVIAGLKVDGFTTGELWRSILLEVSVLLGISCAAGAVFGLAGQLMLSRALRLVTGFPVFYEPAVPSAVFVLALVALITSAMLGVAGFVAVRVKAAPGVGT